MRSACPTISAVIPAYNNEDTIQRALRSVYAQTYPSIVEVIVVDDGSTDGTADLVRTNFPEAHCVYQENAGHAAARNYGVRLARAEMVAFLDADDEWLPEKLAKQMEVFRRYPDASCVGSIMAERVPAAGLAPTDGRRDVVKRITFEAAFSTWAGTDTQTAVIRRQAYEEIGGQDETLRRCVDYEFNLRLLALGHVLLVLPEVLVVRHLDRCSGSMSARGNVLSAWNSVEVSRRCAPDASPPLGGIVTEREYRPVHFRRALLSGLWLIRYGELGQAKRLLAEAVAVAPDLRHKVGAFPMSCAVRALASVLGERSDLLRRVGDLVRGRKYG